MTQGFCFTSFLAFANLPVGYILSFVRSCKVSSSKTNIIKKRKKLVRLANKDCYSNTNQTYNKRAILYNRGESLFILQRWSLLGSLGSILSVKPIPVTFQRYY